MNEVWDLSILYKDFDDPAFTGDMKALDEAIAAVNTLAGEAAGMEHSQLVHRFLQVQERVEELANKLFIFCSLRCSANTADTKANSLGDQLSAKLSGCAAANASLRRTVAELEDLDAIMDADPALEPYRFLLESIRRDSKYLLTDREEELFARMNISGASAWESLRDNLTSSVKVEYDGGITNLSAIRNLAYDPDPVVRKSAYEAELACYDKIKDSVAYALNSIKLQVINECQVRGYASPLDKALYQSRMKRETLDALLGAMDEYLPKFWQYLRAKGKALGHENGLPWYELFAPMGKSDKKYTTQDAKDYLLSIFSGFDSQLHDMVERAFDEAWIDFYPRNGKVGGAFDCGVPSARQSRVLTNFDGAFGDIVTLAHELGHAFHDQQVFSHPLVCQEYTMPVAETASTFNEVLTVSAAIDAAESDDEKLALIESQLSDACQIICDIYSRYLFESAVFAARPEEFLDPDRLCQMMLEAQKKAYGDGLDQTCLHPYMWLCKGHYYSGSLSFYNFPYAFGGLFARGLYAKYQQEGKALQNQYSMLDAQEKADYDRWQEARGDWQKRLEAAQAAYEDAGSQDQKLYQALLAHFSDKAEQERKLSASGVRLTDSGDTGSRGESLSSTAAESLQRAVGNYLKRGNGDLAQALAAQYTARMTPAQRQRFEKLLGQYGMTLA